MYATQKRALTEARQYERAPASVGSAAIAFQQMAGQAGNQAMLAHLGQRSEPAATGESLPNAIMQRFERKSGVPLDDVRVHYNSDKPERFDAEAYAQGNEIFIGPGNEQDLEHEVGHVVQQKQGLVKPTGTEKGVSINDNAILENAAISPVKVIPPKIAELNTERNPIQMHKKRKRGRKEDGGYPKTKRSKPSTDELDKKEKELFTPDKFQGASISDHEVNGKEEKMVGSLYFGGASLDIYPKDEQEEIVKTVEEYLRAKEKLELLQQTDAAKRADEEKRLNDIIKDKYKKLSDYLKAAPEGGRIRTTHDSAPKISRHAHILRMVDPRVEKNGNLLEIFGDERVNNNESLKIRTHPSRGTFVKAKSETKIGKGKGDSAEKIVNKIKAFSLSTFQEMAKKAKNLQSLYKDKIITADEANEQFDTYLKSNEETKGKLPVNPPPENIKYPRNKKQETRNKKQETRNKRRSYRRHRKSNRHSP